MLLEYWAPKVAAKTVVIKSRHGGKAAQFLQSIEGVIISVLVIDISEPVKFICTALDDGIELPEIGRAHV